MTTGRACSSCWRRSGGRCIGHLAASSHPSGVSTTVLHQSTSTQPSSRSCHKATWAGGSAFPLLFHLFFTSSNLTDTKIPQVQTSIPIPKDKMVCFYGGTAYSNENVKHSGPYVIKEVEGNNRVYIGSSPPDLIPLKTTNIPCSQMDLRTATSPASSTTPVTPTARCTHTRPSKFSSLPLCQCVRSSHSSSSPSTTAMSMRDSTLACVALQGAGTGRGTSSGSGLPPSSPTQIFLRLAGKNHSSALPTPPSTLLISSLTPTEVQLLLSM